MTHRNDNAARAEFSRIIRIDDLGTEETHIAFHSSPDEMAALGRRFGVEAIKALEGEAAMKILPSGDVSLRVWFTASVEQRCCVTLALVDENISFEFTRTYSDTNVAEWDHDEEEFEDMAEDIEPPEPLLGGEIDIGEAVAEQLALEINPFPRVKGVTFDGYTAIADGGETPDAVKRNPFAVLSKLKSHMDNDER